MAPTSPTWRDGTSVRICQLDWRADTDRGTNSYYSAESGTCCEVDLLSQPRAGGFSPTKSCRVPPLNLGPTNLNYEHRVAPLRHARCRRCRAELFWGHAAVERLLDDTDDCSVNEYVKRRRCM
ncbi:hypothetical protein M0657_004989 [Pyricularia oryzae]|nr:hypothetical protein M0657_004989 [Pyricularia oryzae]